MLFEIQSKNWRIFLAELAGTFLLLALGDGSVAQYVLDPNKRQNFLSVNIGYAVAVMMGVYVSQGTSGGHLNPAVTVAMAACKKIEWGSVPAYLLGQYTGAFLGAAVAFITYFDALQNYTGCEMSVHGTVATAGIWATYPSTGIGNLNGFGDQIVGTAILLFCVRGITDENNAKIPPYLQPFLVGLCILNLGVSYGYNCGYPLNPARDFSPRLFSLMIYGTETFWANDHWFYVPILACHFGALIGAYGYDLLIGWHLKRKDEQPDTGDIKLTNIE